MMSSRRRLVLCELGAIVAPVAMVFLGRTFLSDVAPVSATVYVQGPSINAPVPTAAKPLSPEQHAAAEWVRQLPDTITLTSPLNHPTEVQKPVVVEVPDTPVHTPLPRTNPVGSLRLTGVMGTEGDQLAAVNGRIYRVGDEVRPGLKLTSIDARAQRITLTDREGETYELRRDK